MQFSIIILFDFSKQTTVMIAQIALFCAIAATALASGYDKPAPYSFGYETADYSGSHSRQESGDAYGNKAGSYSLTGADGRVRKVNYVADGHGFRAQVKTNEPGTTGQDTADAVYNGPDNYGHGHGQVTAHKTVVVAPSYAAHSYAAPAYGHSRSYSSNNGYGYAAPSYGYSRSYGHNNGYNGYRNSGYGYASPSYGHARSYNYNNGYGYAAPSYGYSRSYGHNNNAY
ncbi:Adult-specific rigid cuticular protein 15.5 [Nymphon striatum]|nr:Adult-specific rigid cuticular protein 15.5 [Nymphon striatum]